MNNVIEMSGIVVSNFKFDHEKFDEKFYTLQIESERSSGAKDNIILMVSSNNFDVNQELLGAYMSVVGEIRTHNLRDDEGTHLKVVLFAKSIDVLAYNPSDRIDENSVELNGYLCKINHLRVTPLGRTICDAILAVNRNDTHNDYVPVVFWGKLAEKIDKCRIGTELNLAGRMQSRNYTKNGVLKTVYEVSAQEIEIIS